MKQQGLIFAWVLWGSCIVGAAPTPLESAKEMKLASPASSMRDKSVQSLEESSPFVQYREKVVPVSTISLLSVCQYQRKNGKKFYEFTLKDSLEKKEFVLRSDRSDKNQKYSFSRYDADAKVLFLKNNATGELVSVRQIEQKLAPKTSSGVGNVSSRSPYSWSGTDELSDWGD